MSFNYVDVDSVEGEGPGGAVRKLRRALGAQAFGFNHEAAIRSFDANLEAIAKRQ